MFNVGGGEVLVILLVALLVVGPGKLPEAARQVGNVLTQVRRMSTGFQNELKAALDETTNPSPPPPSGADRAVNDVDDAPLTEPEPPRSRPVAEQLSAGLAERQAASDGVSDADDDAPAGSAPAPDADADV